MTKEKRKISILVPHRAKGDELFVFMQKRSADDKALPGYFGFWGGGAENDETPEAALQREIKEELGIDLDLEHVSLFNRYEFLNNIKHIFLLEVAEGWESAVTIGEGDYGKWFALSEVFAMSDMILEDKVVLNDLERRLLKRPIR